MPVLSGMVMEVKPTPIKTFDSQPDKLQIYWFGTTSYYIQLGEVGVLTDPFVTSGLKNLIKARSDVEKVKRTMGRLKQPPNGIFIGHSHIDHLLDAPTAMLELENWSNVKLYGSASVKNILMGFNNSSLDGRVKLVHVSSAGEWQEIALKKKLRDQGYVIEYMALETTHAPHLSYTSRIFPDLTIDKVFLSNKTKAPLLRAPSWLNYRAAQVYSFLFRLSHKQDSYVVMLSGSTPLKNSPKDLGPIDVLISSAVIPDKSGNYPKKDMDDFKPRVVVLSHFNNFFKNNSDEVLNTLNVPKADIKGVLLNVQLAANYPRFEKGIVPALTELEGNTTKNLIVIKK